jgi:hypothetical protein
LDDSRECEKTLRISELNMLGLPPRIDILAHGITNEEEALRVEGAVIDALWPGRKLTNWVRGFRCLEFGRAPLSELEILYAARKVSISEPALLIRINRLYRPGMTAEALYEATRGVWKIGKRRQHAKYALAVFEGVARQAYAIDTWHPAGTTTYNTRPPDTVAAPGRWEFLGTHAPELADKYCGGSVEKYFPRYSQNPIVYVNC